MKRSLFGKKLKPTFLAIPAAALMLGASQAQTTIGINFSGGAYASSGVGATNAVPQYYAGFPVAVTAFGVAPSNWYTSTNGSSVGVPYNYAANGSMIVGPANSLTVGWTSPDCWGTHIGLDEAITNSAGQIVPPPGNNQVTWGFLDNGGWSVSMSGLNATFPNGYVIQCIAASGDTGAKITSSSLVTDGVSFTNSFVINPIDNGFGLVGLMVETPVLTGDSITLSNPSGSASSLNGFIVTDKPVVSLDPATGTNDVGSTLILNVGAIGIPPLNYQWELNGVNIVGATNSSYTNASLTLADGGSYNLIVTNSYGSTISAVANITVNRAATIRVDLPAAITNFSTMNAAFAPVVGGEAPLTYIWYKNGVALSNTNAVLNLTNLQVSDAANYQVIVTNLYGSATSSVANLTVLSPTPPYEGFDYSVGDLNGQNGGNGGWSGAWTQESGYNGDHMVFAPATPWRGDISELTSVGGALELAAFGTADYDDTRSLQTTLGGNGYGTIYISFVAQVTNTTWGGVELVKDGNASLFLGECWEGSDWGWGTRGAPDATSTTPPSTYSLLVYRFDYTPTNTSVRLYVNPSSLSTEPTNADVSGAEPAVSFDQIRIVSHGFLTSGAGPDGVLDELRIGGTWSSVTPHTLRTDEPFAVQIVPGGVIKDTKPVGTLHDGLNRDTVWLASSTGTNEFSLAPGDTRTGVEQFIQTNATQIVVPADPDFDTTNGTISFWIQYPLSLDTGVLPGPGAEAAMLFDRRTTSGIIVGLDSSGKIEYQFLYPSGGNNVNGTTHGNNNIADGLWHHVALTYDQASNGITALYIDGVLDTQINNPGAWSWPTNQEIELGRSHNSYWYVYDGQMDDLRIYNRILTPTEIGTIGNETTSDTLVDTNALVLRLNFDSDSALFGNSIIWPYGTLFSSPVLGSDAVWTPLTNAVSPQAIVPSDPAMFYRAGGTP